MRSENGEGPRLSRRSFLAGAVSTIAAGCTYRDREVPAGAAAGKAAGTADLVLRSGKVYTVDDARPWAEAIAVRDGHIAYVGTDTSVETYIGPQTDVIELDGRLVLPGFQDVHIHIQEASSLAWTCQLRAEVSPTQLVPTVRRCRPGAGDWILGWGFSIGELIEYVQANGPTPAEVLDRAIPDRPAVMMEQTSQSAWANSLALERAGITATTPNPPGGVIVRDDDGRPNGLLLDAAAECVFDVALERTDLLVELQYEGLLRGLRQLARHGITSIADARVYRRRADLEVWRRVEAEGKLTARATVGLWAYPDMDDDEQISELIALYDPNPDGLLHVSQVKLYSDGITLNGTAALLEPYEQSFLRSIEPLGVGSDTGLNYFDAGRLARYTTELERVGFDAHIHVLGDRGAREGLDAVESAIASNGPEIDRRHRLTHLELVDPADIPRFADLSVIADIQVSGRWTLPDAWSDNEPIVGERARRFIPLRELHNAGAIVTLSSDWDVSSMDPLVGIQHALARAPQSLPSLEDAIRAYTLSPAYALRQEDTTGSIEVGKLADLVVLDKNLFEIPVGEITDASVVLTLLAGREVFHA